MLAFLVPDTRDRDESWADRSFGDAEEKSHCEKASVCRGRCKTHANGTPNNSVQYQTKSTIINCITYMVQPTNLVRGSLDMRYMNGNSETSWPT